MDFEVYAYWNTVELAAIFNAVASITGSGDFNGLLRTLALVGMISLVLTVLAGRGRMEDMWRWVIMMAIFNSMLLVPKSNVIIVDRTGTQAPATVANVPIGLASFAHGISKIGDWLTTSFETVFALPDDIQFRKNGTLFGHRVLREIQSAKIENQIVFNDFIEFYRECVQPELATNTLTAEDLMKSSDIWTTLNGATNPSRLVTIADPDTRAASTVGCNTAYTSLNAWLTTDANTALQRFGQSQYPDMTAANAKAAITSAIQTTDGYMVGVARAAVDRVRNAQVANAVIDAPYAISAQLGDAASAATNLDAARAIRSMESGYVLMAKVAESTMPKIRNIIEMIQYAVFPIVLLMIVVAGHYGGTVLKGYLMSLMWVQLWPPLYAVMHYIMTLHGAADMTAATGGLAESLSQYNYINNATISEEAIAGFMSATVIPAVAWGLVQAGMVGMQAMMNIAQPSRETEKLGTSAALGNRQQGVYASNVANFENVSGGHWDTRPTIRQGGMVMSARGGYDMFVAPDGTTTIDATAIKQDGKLGASIKMSSRTSASLQQQSEQLESSAVAEAVSAAHSTSAALGQIADFSRTHAKNQRAGTHYGSGDRGEFSQAASTVTKTMDSFAEKNNLNQKQVTELFGMAQTGASVPGALKLISPLDFEAKTGIKVGSTAEASALIEKARSTMREQGFTTAMNKARQSVRERMFDTGDESSRRAADGIRTSLDLSQQHTDQASASHQQSLAYKEAASRVRENAATFDAGLTRQFVDWMRTLDNPISGRKFDYGTVVQMAEKNPELLEPFKDRFFKEHIEPQLINGVSEVNGPEAVRANFEEGRATMPGKEHVTAQGNDWLGVVKGTATSAGVNPDKSVTSSLPAQVGKALEKTGVQVAAGKATVDATGKPIKQKANDATDHGKQNLLGIAVMNGSDALLPQGTMYLADIAGMVPDHATFANGSATSYKGDTMDAFLDTGKFAAWTAIGGFVGRFGGTWLGGKAATTELNATVGKATETATRSLQAARVEAHEMEQALERVSDKVLGKAGDPKVRSTLASKEKAIEGKLAATKEAAWKKAEQQTEGRRLMGALGGGAVSDQKARDHLKSDSDNGDH